LFALHQLFRKPEQFSTYIIVSPAIGWNDGDILKEEPSFVARAKAGEIKVRILFTAAADESPRMVADAKAISERLAPLNPQKVHVEYVAFAGEDHVSVSLASVGRALFFALKKR
jgi:predicted alpha/beta superfamily hydrolase